MQLQVSLFLRSSTKWHGRSGQHCWRGRKRIPFVTSIRRSSGSATATAQSHRMLLKSARYPASHLCSVRHWSVAALQQRASFAFALFRLVVIVAASTVVDAVFLLHVRIFNNSAANAVYFRLTRTGALRRRQPLPLLNRPPTCPLPIWIPYVSVSYSLFGSP